MMKTKMKMKTMATRKMWERRETVELEEIMKESGGDVRVFSSMHEVRARKCVCWMLLFLTPLVA